MNSADRRRLVNRRSHEAREIVFGIRYHVGLGRRTDRSRGGRLRMTVGAFGPWIPNLQPVEERAQLRLIAGVAASFIDTSHPIIATLRRAEGDASAKAEALRMLNVLPSLTRRTIMSTYAGVMWAKQRARHQPMSWRRRQMNEPAEPVARFSDLPPSEVAQ
jgi:hypothetical protein